ncbi:MAG: hypothetical protein QXN87_06050 [Candidatus Bathyarchaeia archaeon]
MSKLKIAFTAFHYAEKIKTNLILASNLLETLSQMDFADVSGGEKILAAYFNALMAEVNIAANASQIEGFREVNLKLEDTVEKIRKHNYADAERLVSEAICITTTQGSRAAQTLREEGLI